MQYTGVARSTPLWQLFFDFAKLNISISWVLIAPAAVFWNILLSY